jgi:hypothetical protein
VYTIRMGSDVAEAQIDDLSDAEIDVLLEVYEVLRLTPGNGRKLRRAGNMHVWDYKGISVTYVLLDPQREVAVLRVDPLPHLKFGVKRYRWSLRPPCRIFAKLGGHESRSAPAQIAPLCAAREGGPALLARILFAMQRCHHSCGQ